MILLMTKWLTFHIPVHTMNAISIIFSKAEKQQKSVWCLVPASGSSSLTQYFERRRPTPFCTPTYASGLFSFKYRLFCVFKQSARRFVSCSTVEVRSRMSFSSDLMSPCEFLVSHMFWSSCKEAAFHRALSEIQSLYSPSRQRVRVIHRVKVVGEGGGVGFDVGFAFELWLWLGLG